MQVRRNKGFVIGKESTMLLALMLVSSSAFAAGGIDMSSLNVVTDLLKSFAKLLFVEWGYYIAIIASAFMAFMAWQGRMEWGRAITFVIVVCVFFALPAFIGGIRDSGASNF